MDSARAHIAPREEGATFSSGYTDLERTFQLDALLDMLTSGRANGVPVDPAVAGVLVHLLEELEIRADARDVAGALPHFPIVFEERELRSSLGNLGATSNAKRVVGRQLERLNRAAVVVCEDGLWLIDLSGRVPCLARNIGTMGAKERRPIRRFRSYRVVQFEVAPPDHLETVPILNPKLLDEIVVRLRGELRLIGIASVLSGAIAIAAVYGIIMVFDVVIPSRNLSTLMGILVGLILLFALDIAIRSIKSDCIGRVSATVEYDVAGALFRKLLSLPPAMISTAPIGDQMARLRQFEKVRDMFGGPMAAVVFELPLLLVILGCVALIAWQIALLQLTLIAVILTFGLLATPGLRREGRGISVKQNAVTRLLLDLVGQQKQISQSGVWDSGIRKLDSAVVELVRQRRRNDTHQRAMDALAQGSLPLSATVVVGAGAMLVMSEQMTPGQLVAATILTWRLFAPVQQLVTLLPQFFNMADLFRQIGATMALPSEQQRRPHASPRVSKGRLRANDLVLRFPNALSPTIAGATLNIPHGTFVTVTGGAGSGKTSLLKVLSGQLAQQSGTVLLNEVNIQQLSPSSRAASIALVPEEPLFFYGTVAQNLRFAVPGAPDDLLLQTLDEVGLAGWVSGLPKGIDTRLDPDKDSLFLTVQIRSALALAQALLRRTPVVMLDNPQGGLDPELEASALAAIDRRRGQVTTLMATHRPTIMRRSDAIIVIDKGRVRMTRPDDMRWATG